jgi:hypothetical protein
MAYILVVQDIIGYFLVFHSLIARQTGDQLKQALGLQRS